MASHKECPDPRKARLPKRVLQIATGDRPDTFDIKLVTTEGQTGTYATLSHCWGRYQPIRTLVENAAGMEVSIPWHDLSPVFRNAIQVAANLQISYLWIDSLCIIQDSAVDWETEAAKMADYYENSITTISAASSVDGSQPSLRDHDARWKPRSFEFRNLDGSVSTLKTREVLTLTEYTERDPLYTRAWVWQETVLSTRNISFCAAGLVWDCRAESVGEDGSDGRFFTLKPSARDVRSPPSI